MHGLDLAIEPGERVLLLGPSGAGKSTLIAALAGVLGGAEEGEQAGWLGVGGLDAAGRAHPTGLVLQDADSQGILARVGDDVAFGLENLAVPASEIWQRVRSALDAVGLDVALDRPTAALSGGQAQRLALAGAFAMRPGLMLLDEPTANLDHDGVAQVRRSVERLSADRGMTVIIVEHRVGTWLDLVDRIVVLGADGSLVADGPPRAVLAASRTELEAAGVWLPDLELPRRPASHATGAPLLEARGLGVGRRGASVAASDLDVDLAPGAPLVVTGPNGAGKTTLALTLGGLLVPRAGEVRATPGLSRGAATEPHRWRSRELLTRIGSVFQNPEHQFLAATVRDELALGPRALHLRPGEVTARVDELLERLGLAPLAAANPFTLSGGQKRRLSVGTALATRPQVLLLDEPTFGQDARSWRELVGLLAELAAAGHAIAAVSHDEHLAAALGAGEWRLGARAMAR